VTVVVTRAVTTVPMVVRPIWGLTENREPMSAPLAIPNASAAIDGSTSSATVRTSRARRWSIRGAVAVVVALVVLVQVFYTTSGIMWGQSKYKDKTYTAWWGQSHYYNEMADGFVAGQLSLTIKPNPELVVMQDPYEPSQNHNKRLHDAVLFKDVSTGEWRYYLYWGPVPGVIVTIAKLINGQPLLVGDQELVMLFSFLTVLFSTMLLVWVYENLMPETPVVLLLMAVAMTGLLPTHIYFIMRPAVYEASIMGGQAFLIAGLFFAVLGAGPKVRSLWLLHAGVAWGLAIGCRMSLSPAIAFLCLMVAIRVWAMLGILKWRAWLPAALALGLPMIAACLGWLVYNQMRFGDPFETGLRWQLAAVHVSKMLELGYSSWRNIDANVTQYLFCPVNVVDTFPFLVGNASMPELPLHHYVAPHHAFEVVCGIVYSSPILLFALVPLLLVVVEWRKGRANTNLEKWISVVLIFTAVLAFFPAITLAATTMRYLMDFQPLLALATGIGIWQAARPFVRSRRTYYTLAGVLWVLSAWTLLVAFAFGFGGYANNFKEHNPKLYQKFEKFFS